MSRRPKTVILSGLTSIHGLQFHHSTLIDERQWVMPSLGRVDGHACGGFICTSSSLTHLEVRPLRGLLDLLGRVPLPVEGQRGTLQGLRTLGVIQTETTRGLDEEDLVQGIDQLKDVLSGHKVRSITEIKAVVPVVDHTIKTSKLLIFVRALEELKASLTPATLTRTAFTRAPEIVLVSPNWNKTLKLDLPLPPPPAPLPSLFSDAMRYFSSRAETVVCETRPAPISRIEPEK
ncbi:unnamed protein product [Vitrella brassicaformis CCMP3155]|uniref:Uncharacterized protein n=1 Tax=Vitrella brassicaformis (strain CCMP3155) TaxID=1169540 RepID=A0A0G4EJR7_VITBC|nr:unnamed protein product [Vitrella brassicaformis CCMP3155]|eukprot:CEL97675.1 unnamed protein product [Vitrella brassicaformis CCMP3155]